MGEVMRCRLSVLRRVVDEVGLSLVVNGGSRMSCNF